MTGDQDASVPCWAEALEARVTANEERIAELQAEGSLRQERTENLTRALRTSRTIGAAVGIVMVTHQVTEDSAFEMLRRTSMDTNQKLRDLAAHIVMTGVAPLDRDGWASSRALRETGPDGQA